MTDLTELFGITSPLVLGPFGGVSSADLTAEVSAQGGLGSFGLYGYDAERIRRAVADIRARTDRPFALNLWLPVGDEVPPGASHASYADALGPWFQEVGLAPPERPAAYMPELGEQLDAVWDAKPAVLSFVFGAPSAEIVSEAHERGIRVVGTATTVAEAVVLETSGVDAVVATGSEAGGHRVSFLEPAERSLVGTFALVPQVVDAVDLPVIAAGGIADRRGVAAAFALGARGVQVGTAFLAADESAAPASHRAAIHATAAEDTVLTRAMSGRLARGARNRVVEEIENAGAIAPFPAQNWLTGRFRAAAAAEDRGDLLSLWMGQSAPLARGGRAADVFAELAAGVPGARS